MAVTWAGTDIVARLGPKNVKKVRLNPYSDTILRCFLAFLYVEKFK